MFTINKARSPMPLLEIYEFKVVDGPRGAKSE